MRILIVRVNSINFKIPIFVFGILILVLQHSNSVSAQTFIEPPVNEFLKKIILPQEKVRKHIDKVKKTKKLFVLGINRNSLICFGGGDQTGSNSEPDPPPEDIDVS